MILFCNDPYDKGCFWSGDESELVCTDEDEDCFTHCPQCGGTDFEEEEEDDELDDEII